MEKPQDRLEPSMEELADDGRSQCEPQVQVGGNQTAIAAHPQGTEEDAQSQGLRAAPGNVQVEETVLEQVGSGACGSGSTSAETLQDLSPSVHAPRLLLNKADITIKPRDTFDTLELGEKHSKWPGRMNEFGSPLPAKKVELYKDSRESSTSTLASSEAGLGDIDYSTTSLPQAAWTAQGTSADQNNQTLKRATSKPPRPTSVPITTYGSTSIAMATGAKTVGSTPAQSPGLFSPLFPSGRSQVDESEDSQTSTPLMHPAHLQTPKETHKLSKEIDPLTGQKQVNNYKLHRKLGQGQHGTVKLGQDLNTKEWIAMKIVRRYPRKRRLRRTEDPSDMVKKEVAILKKARHPHVVSLLEVIDDEQYEKVYLVLEYVELGEILWRKKTDKDVAIFEMDRIKREVAGDFDDEYEKAEVERFNNTAVARRREKAEAYEKRRSSLGQGGEANDFGRPTSAASEASYWEAEHGGEPEDREPLSMAGSGLGLNLAEQAGYDSALATSIHDSMSRGAPETPRPVPTEHQDTFFPDQARESAPVSPADLEGTMYGPYVSEEQSSDSKLASIIDRFINDDNDWTPEQVEYMYVPCLTISQALDVFRDTVLGLEFLHYQGIIHRDIKPANLLWTADHRVKISDFGVSYIGKPIRPGADNDDISAPDAADVDEAIELAKTVGTPAFYAPELCNPDIFANEGKARPPITGQIDVWALGVTLYCMIFGRLPFHDSSEYHMYEKIADSELFIPRQRLKAVENKPQSQMNSSKRFDDIVEYEDVDDELRHLLKRLLHKDPSQRISIKEVKHHPWLLRGISNQPKWIDETDPNLQSEGRKIEISDQDVKEAFAPAVTVTFVDKLKASIGTGITRMASAVRGRNRKRAESDTKSIEKQLQSNLGGTESRRASLRGDELLPALRASRENSEHPLAQSVTASPEFQTNQDYFDEDSMLMMADNRSSPHAKRPNLPERTVSSISNTESMKTIRASVPPIIREDVSPSPHTGNLSTTTTIVEASPPSASGLSGIFGGGVRRTISKIHRSRDRGRTRDGPSNESSRSSSVENPHGSPSLAFSTAVAAGHVDQPPSLRDSVSTSTPPPTGRPPLRHAPSSEAYLRAQALNDRRQILEHAQATNAPLRHRAVSSAASAANVACPPSPDDDGFPLTDQASPAAETAPFGVSSSSDQMASNLSGSVSHTSMPDVFSGASSLSGTMEPPEYPLEKTASPSTIVPEKRESIDENVEEDLKLTPSEGETKSTVEADEAGYNGEGELDSDSDDGGLTMGGPKKKAK
ncbi:MAG: hypothetical protein Q9174_000476 [Haloplaca sp. 1 TL-2023]